MAVLRDLGEVARGSLVFASSAGAGAWLVNLIWRGWS